MIKKALFIPVVLSLFISACGMMQSIVKSTFPYTANLLIPASSEVGQSYAAVSLANSFDQNFSRSGNNGNNVSEVTMISARLQSTSPADFNLGDLKSVKIYMAKEDGKDEVLVASRDDISADVGNTMVLDIDNSNFLDQLIRQPDIRIKMIYELRKKTGVDVSIHVVLSLNAYPAKKIN